MTSNIINDIKRLNISIDSVEYGITLSTPVNLDELKLDDNLRYAFDYPKINPNTNQPDLEIIGDSATSSANINLNDFNIIVQDVAFDDLKDVLSDIILFMDTINRIKEYKKPIYIKLPYEEESLEIDMIIPVPNGLSLKIVNWGTTDLLKGTPITIEFDGKIETVIGNTDLLKLFKNIAQNL